MGSAVHMGFTMYTPSLYYELVRVAGPKTIKRILLLFHRLSPCFNPKSKTLDCHLVSWFCVLRCFLHHSFPSFVVYSGPHKKLESLWTCSRSESVWRGIG